MPVATTDLIGFTQAGAGAVERSAESKLREVISVTDFGAVGDGATDNATALLAMRDYCEANFQSTGVNIFFPPGTYQYSDNKWLPHCRNVTVRGPAKLQCTQSTGTSANWDPLFSGDLFIARWTGNPGTIVGVQTGYAIEDAAAQASSVTLVTAGDAAQFTVGMPVFIHGFVQQRASYPLNVRYFEWNEVTAIDGGVITLTKRLRERYSRTDWEDYETNDVAAYIHGKPRIVPLHRSDFYYRENLVIENLEWLNNPNKPYPADANGFMPVGRNVVLRNVRLNGYFWPQQSEFVSAIDCYIENASDLDKIVDTVVMERCILNSWVGAATGINNVIIRDCLVNGRLLLGSKRIEVTGSKIVGDTSYGVVGTHDTTPTSFVRLINNDCYLDDNNNYLINNDTNTMTPTTTAAGSFKLAAADFVSFYRLGIGHQIFDATYSKVSTIRNLTWDGTDYVVHHGSDVTFTGGVAVFTNTMAKTEHSQNKVTKAGVLVDQDYFMMRYSGPLFEETNGQKIYRGRPFINGEVRYPPIRFVGRAQKMVLVARAVHSTAVYWDISATNSADDFVKLCAGSTPAAGDYVVVDLVAGTATFVGSWTSTSGLSVPWNGIIRNIFFTISNSDFNAPTYTSFADTPYFEIIFDGVTGLGG